MYVVVTTNNSFNIFIIYYYYYYYYNTCIEQTKIEQSVSVLVLPNVNYIICSPYYSD